MRHAIRNAFTIVAACAIIFAAGCDQKAITNPLSAGPEVAVNEFQKEVDKGNVVTARQYLSTTFNGLPKDDERVTETMLTAAENNRKHGGVEYPVTDTACQILGETAKCPRVLRFKDNSAGVTTTVDLIKLDGKWLIRGIAKTTAEARK